MRLIHEFTDGDFSVKLFQNGKDKFTVQYGLQSEGGLNYASAAHRYGECVFHSLACAGKLDNRTKGES